MIKRNIDGFRNIRRKGPVLNCHKRETGSNRDTLANGGITFKSTIQLK